ncbi:uncharacterized protein [Ptychodera flava]|uniref:uncharacterized protein n=1 Tax=Ptychodera flava TaxID=63121 RepID=UPI00396A65BF
MASLTVLAALTSVLAMFKGYHVSALTDEQIAKFQTTGITESNTGMVGTVTVTTKNGKHIIESNGIPDHATGSFPNVDNPNNIQFQSYHFEIPVTPTEASEVGCLPMGPIGMAVNGIPIFNPFTREGNNAVEGEYAEVFDLCDGHPDQPGHYHYHKAPSCVMSRYSDASPLIGVAFDGYAIYGPTDENGNTLTTDDLDQCHGRVVNGVYQYHITADYPYFLGCYRGDLLSTSGVNTRGECYFAYSRAAIPAIPLALLLLFVTLVTIFTFKV